MIFQQQVNFGMNNQEFKRICAQHPECNNCPFLTQDMQLQGGMTRCETGRTHENESK